MNLIVSKILMYGDMPQDSILMELSAICADLREQRQTKEELTKRVFRQVKRLLILATDYGFNKNLWQDYLTFLLITNENPFSITCEKTGAHPGSVNYFAKSDFKAFQQLFDYDFEWLEQELCIDCFTRLSDYTAIGKPELMYNKNVSEKVRALSEQLAAASDEEQFFVLITDFYKAYGVGMFGLNKAFRISKDEIGKGIVFHPINNMDKVMLDDLIGYEIQKKKLTDNTRAFVEGRKANNVLLFGDSGTGKSTSIKALVNAFEIEYKFLKAVIEGGVETKPENILIYATSNRRHIIKETWSDRDDIKIENGMHQSDTMEEKLSLVNRFGVTINYSKPSQKEYFQIVTGLARRAGLTMSDDELRLEANRWELSHGGISGRTAQQFVNYLLGCHCAEE